MVEQSLALSVRRSRARRAETITGTKRTKRRRSAALRAARSAARSAARRTPRSAATLSVEVLLEELKRRKEQ